jgi:hypothetical protein
MFSAFSIPRYRALVIKKKQFSPEKTMKKLEKK